MTIGFFGKGGSGKTTTCFHFLESNKGRYESVLAIDGDHNMDLSYNLGVQDIAPFVGSPGTLSNRLLLLAAGPHTEAVFNGDVCSHYLFRPFKEYLKNRAKDSDELVVVDNTAGMDSVGAGIPALIDVAVVCIEPALHSMKVGRQILDALTRTRSPAVIAANKIRSDEQARLVSENFQNVPVIRVPLHDATDPSQPVSDEVRQAFLKLHDVCVDQISRKRPPTRPNPS